MLFRRLRRRPVQLDPSSPTTSFARAGPIGVVTVVADYRTPSFVLYPPPAVILG